MRKVPTLITVDDFYDNPMGVRELALSLEFAKSPRTNYPGSRTGHLQEVAPEFYQMWEEKFFDIFGGMHNGEWRFSTQFQLIPADLEDPEINEGWTHCDDTQDIGGVIYLNPEPDYEAGTSFMRPKAGLNPQVNAHLRFRNDYYGGRNNITKEEFIRAKAFHNGKYENDIVVSNDFNRMIAFNSLKPHKQSKFGRPGELRLTQVFFAKMIKE
jgi:hypothetical protein